MSNKYVESFLKEWELQQGAVFLKKDEIYAFRRELAEYFFRKGFEAASLVYNAEAEAYPRTPREFKFEIGQIVSGRTFGGRDTPNVLFDNGIIIERFYNWLGGPCYVVEFGDDTYRLQEERINYE